MAKRIAALILGLYFDAPQERSSVWSVSSALTAPGGTALGPSLVLNAQIRHAALPGCLTHVTCLCHLHGCELRAFPGSNTFLSIARGAPCQ